jgi:hypothetical protein
MLHSKRRHVVSSHEVIELDFDLPQISNCFPFRGFPFSYILFWRVPASRWMGNYLNWLRCMDLDGVGTKGRGRIYIDFITAPSKIRTFKSANRLQAKRTSITIASICTAPTTPLTIPSTISIKLRVFLPISLLFITISLFLVFCSHSSSHIF